MNLTSEATPASASLPIVITRAVTVAALSLFAISGNILVIGTIVMVQKLHVSANLFIGNLAASNLVTGILLIFLTWNVVFNGNVLGTVGCEIWAVLVGTTIVCSTFDMALVAVNRYILIARPKMYRNVYTIKKSVLMSASTWLIGFANAVGMVAGWSEVRYNERTMACSYRRQDFDSFHYFAITIGFGIPLLTVIVSYSMLYHVVRQSRKRVSARSATRTNIHRNNREARLTKLLVAILLIYIFCLGPYSILNFIDAKGTKFTEDVHVFVTWLMFSNAAINPFIYGFMNKTYRNGYKAMVRKLKCKSRQGFSTKKANQEMNRPKGNSSLNTESSI